jgi:hypothetical protein
MSKLHLDPFNILEGRRERMGSRCHCLGVEAILCGHREFDIRHFAGMLVFKMREEFLDLETLVPFNMHCSVPTLVEWVQ